jgi:hypothetical protein
MKKSFLITAAFVTSIAAQAQPTDFRIPLKTTFDAFDTTYNNAEARVGLSNKLVLIAKKWPAEWSTNYYAAYSRIQLSYNDKLEAAKRDAYLDEAETFRDETVKLLGKDNTETYTLSAMIANGRLSVDGRSRWQKYGKIFDENLENAKKLNPDNPRIYLLRGISKCYTPKMFGGGKKAAMPYFEKAETLFSQESTDDITRPYWGRTSNTFFMKQVSGQED